MNLEQYAEKARADEKLLQTQREMNMRDRRRRAEEETVEVAREMFYKHPLASGELLPQNSVEWVLMSVQKTSGVRWDSANSRYAEDVESEAIVSVWRESKSQKDFLHVVEINDSNSNSNSNSSDSEEKFSDLGIFQPNEKEMKILVQMNALSAVRRQKIERLSDIV